MTTIASARSLAASSLATAADTYFYALAASSTHGNGGRETLLATIGSDDALRVFDPASLDLVHVVASCHAGVSCLTSRPQHDGFVTAGRDGLIKLWDARAKQPSVQLSESAGRGISAVACHGEYYIASGTESTKEGLGDVSVLIHDVRNPSAPLRNYAESHTDSVTQLAFHPSRPQVLLSASTDGLVSLFDVDQSDEDDALQQVLNPRSAVHCAGFLAEEQVYVVTTDEHCSIYPLSEKADGSSDPTIEFGDVRSPLSCMYVIDVRPRAGTEPVMIYGHNEAKTLSIVQLQGGPDAWSFGRRLDFPGAHGEEVVRDVLFSSDGTHIYTCGEDSHVRLWRSATDTEIGEHGESPRVKKKRRDKKSDRYAPY